MSMALLVQFLLRLAFGLAAGMAIVSPRQVTSGYYRNNLYVALGLSALAALLSRAAVPAAFWYAVGAALISYVGSVLWLYESSRPGRLALVLLAIVALSGAHQTSMQLQTSVIESGNADKYFREIPAGTVVNAEQANALSARARRIGLASGILAMIATVSSGLLIGTTMAAMLLGHWYLNSPTMHLAPLRRLIVAMGFAAAIHAVASAVGLWGELSTVENASTQWLLFIFLRWTFGLIAVVVLAWMAWQTLKIPNTQSATGILYVAVIGVFVGETTSLLLSAESVFPV